MTMTKEEQLEWLALMKNAEQGAQALAALHGRSYL